MKGMTAGPTRPTGQRAIGPTVQLVKTSDGPSSPNGPQPRPALPVSAQSTMPVVGLNDMKEENDDDERQAYYAGGNTAAGGGRCAACTSELPDPLELPRP